MFRLIKSKIPDDNLIVVFIIIVASLLRLYNFWDLPFMHDEFSAILRTHYNNLHDLIEYGVKQNDSHPAGVQVFIYYWIRIFGLHEWSLKLPFIISGIISVYLIYRIGRLWFGKQTAIFSSLVFAIIQYAVFYSQLARPYSPGLMFVLLSTIYWSKLIVNKQFTTRIIIPYILAAAAASYIHAFSLFFILIQGLTGLLFFRTKLFWKYIFVNIFILILYLPHIPIFLAQLGRGDIGGWLAVPKSNFLLHFLAYSLNYSQIFYFTIIISVFFLSTSSKAAKPGNNKFRWVAISWFLCTYLTAHLYSVYRSPILQNSTLIFVFPFLILLMFSFIGNIKKNIQFSFIVLIAVVGIFSLVFGRQHYKIMYEQGFDGIAENISNDMNKMNSQGSAIILQAPEPRMFDYYMLKNHLDTNYLKITLDNKPGDLIKYLDTNKPKTVFYGCADYSDLTYLAILKSKFKYVIKRKSFFNSEYFVLSNNLISDTIDIDKHIIGNTNIINSKPVYKLQLPGFSPSIEIQTDSVRFTKYNVINLTAKIRHAESNTNSLLVMDLQDKNGKSVWWTASELKNFMTKDQDSGFIAINSKRLLNHYPITEGSVLKAYIWKQDSSYLEAESIKVYLSNIRAIELGLYEKLY
jgi:hypothetical protein